MSVDETGAAEEIWAAIGSLYDSFLAGDQAGIDRWIDPAATLWDNAHPPLIRGLGELDAVRKARPAGDLAPKVTAITRHHRQIDLYGETAVVRYVFVVHYADAGYDVVRNTGVWRRSGSGWRIVHNHEDQLPAGTPAPVD